MLTFTFDTNCLIDLDEGRREAASIRDLADAHARGEASIAVVAISASETQKNGARLTNFNEFRNRLKTLDLGHLEILKPMAYWGIAFWGWAYSAGPEMVALERQIHNVLFPNIEFDWIEFCRNRGWDSIAQPVDLKWRNAKCDVQVLWSHIYYRREIFVTSDANFHAASKRPTLIALGAGSIERPQAAAALVVCTSGKAV